eukprot:g3285.t1
MPRLLLTAFDIETDQNRYRIGISCKECNNNKQYEVPKKKLHNLLCSRLKVRSIANVYVREQHVNNKIQRQHGTTNENDDDSIDGFESIMKNAAFQSGRMSSDDNHSSVFDSLPPSSFCPAEENVQRTAYLFNQRDIIAISSQLTEPELIFRLCQADTFPYSFNISENLARECHQQGYTSLPSALRYLKTHSTTGKCSLCGSLQPDVFRFANACRHVFCRPCLVKNLLAKLPKPPPFVPKCCVAQLCSHPQSAHARLPFLEIDSANLCCPFPQCWHVIGTDDIRTLLGEREYTKILDHSTTMFIAKEQYERSQELKKKRYTCGICFDDECKIEDMYRCNSQTSPHMFCRGCFSGYIENKIQDAKVDFQNDLVCPGFKCNESLTVHEIKANVDPPIWEKYEKFMLRDVCESAADLRGCPKCEWFAEVDQNNPAVWSTVKCGNPRCGHKFCGKCGEEPHNLVPGETNQTCEEYARWKEENAEGDNELAKLMKSTGWKRCPKCRAIAELKGTCKRFPSSHRI